VEDSYPGNEISVMQVNLVSEARMIQVGEFGSNFSLKDQHDKTFDLLESSGKKILLSFHPLAWTPFCAGQMISLEQNIRTFKSMDVIAVGISVDSVPCKKAWAETLGLVHTRILADFWPHGKVAMMYGIFRETNGFSERANIILDEKQKVIFTKVYPVHSIPDIDEVIGFLKNVT
jgi:peroxiredoxin